MIRRPPRSTQSRSSAASDVYKRQVHGLGYVEAAVTDIDADANLFFHRVLVVSHAVSCFLSQSRPAKHLGQLHVVCLVLLQLSLIHISEPTRLGMISYAVFC